MANHLKMAKIHAIVTLHERGWSNRRIARELGVDRETVGRHLALAVAEAARVAANPPPGSGDGNAGTTEANPATAGANPPLGAKADGTGVYAPEPATTDAPNAATNPPLGSEGATETVLTGPPSACEPFRALIQAKLEAGLSGRRIYQDLAGEPHSPSYDSVKRFLRHLARTTPVPFRRMEQPPGQEAQVDFGTGAPVVGPDGKRLKTYVFRIVLSCSRKAYSEAVYRQTTEDFIACLENAFHAFGGVPRTLVIDNLRAAVVHPDWFDPELVPRLEAFCRHYGTVILPAKPYMPRHKGKVERGVAYVQDNGLKGYVFVGLSEQNQHLRTWELGVADKRIHGTTRQQVARVFEQVERPALLPLPQERFPFFHESLRTVHRDGHVAVEKAYYSVPPEYVGRQVWVRWDAHLVKLFNQRREPIAVHARQEPGRFSTADVHILGQKTSKVEKGTAWLLAQAARLGPEVAAWSQAMLQERGVAGVRTLVGLLALATRQPGVDLERACRIATSHQAYRLRALRALLKEPAPTDDDQGAVGEQTSFAYLDAHPIIRDLHEYDQLVHEAFVGSEPALTAEGPR